MIALIFFIKNFAKYNLYIICRSIDRKVCSSVSSCKHIYVHAYIYILVHVHVCIHICICLYACGCVYVFVCIYILEVLQKGKPISLNNNFTIISFIYHSKYFFIELFPPISFKGLHLVISTNLIL